MTTLSYPQRQALLNDLRSREDWRTIEQLQKLYHDREMERLSDDVYDAAQGKGEPPSGWTRASEHLDKLRDYAPRLTLSNDELVDLLKPDKSGFRAEIYLPDPTVLGPGYKPTVVFKGSSGEILDANAPGGKRDTTAEDFLANNFPQSVGLRTDYYDRAMNLASELKLKNFGDFELAGHSLAGGMASAASAISGMPATTYNAAGLHPETARRFATENRLSVYDANHLVTAYYVQGELLNDGVQHNVQRMDALHRAQLAGVIKETSELLQALPEGRVLLKRMLDTQVPVHAQASVHAFIDTLATGNAQQLLRELPLAAGQVQPPLVAMTEQDGRLVARARERSLQEIAFLAGPVLKTLHAATMGAHAGHRAGEVAAASGDVAGQALDASGDLVRRASQAGAQASRTATHLGGAAVATGIRQSGRTAAGVREMAGETAAQIDQLQGRAHQQSAEFGTGLLRGVSRLLPERAQSWLESQAARWQHSGDAAYQRNLAEAAEARHAGHADAERLRNAARMVEWEMVRRAARAGELQHAAIAAPGRLTDQVLETAGRHTQAAAARAPTLGAGAGAATAGTAAAMAEFNPLNPGNYPNLAKTAALAQHGQRAEAEAFQRHLMQPTVRPSLEARIADIEQQALQDLQLTAARQQVLWAQQQMQRQQRRTEEDRQREAEQRHRLDREDKAYEPQKPTTGSFDAPSLARTPAALPTSGRDAMDRNTTAFTASREGPRRIEYGHERYAPQPQQASREREYGAERFSAPAPSLLPFSDARHPKHALYADAKQRLEAQGHYFSDDRLNQITAQLRKSNFDAGWEGQITVSAGKVHALDNRNLWNGRAHIALTEPTPSAQQTMQEVHQHDQDKQQQAMEWQQRQLARSQSGPSR